jgi:hypothetical protein
MRRKQIFIAIAAALIISSTTACDLLFGSGNWNCSAPAGKYERNSQRVDFGPKTVTGEIYFESTDHSTRWTPAATLAFATSETDCLGCAGLQLTKYAPYPEHIQANLLIAGKPVGGAWLLHKRPTPFKMTLYDDGTLNLEIGRHGVKLTNRAFNYSRIFLNSSCSSAGVSFRNIVVSRATN